MLKGPARREYMGSVSIVPLSVWIRERLRRVAAGELREAGHENPFRR